MAKVSYKRYALLCIVGICLMTVAMVSRRPTKSAAAIKDHNHISDAPTEELIKDAGMDSLETSSLRFLLDHSEGLLSYQPSIDSFFRDATKQQLPFILSNIEDAHHTCRFQIERGLNRKIFLNYILPHKIFSERAENWRQKVREEYKDFSVARDTGDYVNCTRKVVDHIRRWFKFSSNAGQVCSFTYSDLRNRGKGDCITESLLGVYTLRSLGVPVSMDFTCSFGNFDGAMHMWNSIVYSDKHAVPFMAAESYPGEYDPFAIILDKRYPALTTYKKCAKVFRRTYSVLPDSACPVKASFVVPEILKDNRFADVSDQYLNVSNIRYFNRSRVQIAAPGYICVFNNGAWMPAYWSDVKHDGSLLFPKMGRGLLYMVAAFHKGTMTALSHPFFLSPAGKVQSLDAKGDTIPHFNILSLKSPLQLQMDTMSKIMDNRVFDKIMRSIAMKKTLCGPILGNEYILAVWKGRWIPLQKQICTFNGLTFENVPSRGLYKILLPGQPQKETRVFTYDPVSAGQQWL